MAVVVALVLAEHGGGVPLVDDQDAVQDFADAADEAFGDRVGPRRRTGVLMMRTPIAVNTASNAAVNLPRPASWSWKGGGIPQVRFSVARRRTRLRRPAGWRVDRAGRAGWSSGGRRAVGASAGWCPA
jgi:hypothetical protein